MDVDWCFDVLGDAIDKLNILKNNVICVSKLRLNLVQARTLAFFVYRELQSLDFAMLFNIAKVILNAFLISLDSGILFTYVRYSMQCVCPY